MKNLCSSALKLWGFTAGAEFALGGVRMTVFVFAFQIFLFLRCRFRTVYTYDYDLNELGHTNHA